MKATTLSTIIGTMLHMVAAPGMASAVPIPSKHLTATLRTTLTAYAGCLCESGNRRCRDRARWDCIRCLGDPLQLVSSRL